MPTVVLPDDELLLLSAGDELWLPPVDATGGAVVVEVAAGLWALAQPTRTPAIG